MKYDYVFKIILIGDANVGKTTIIHSFTENKVDLMNMPTIGVEYIPKVIRLQDGTKVKLAIWDTAGQERYRSIIRSYFRDVVGVIVVYDITHKQTFDHVSHWIELSNTECHVTPTICVVGNKLDLAPYRMVPDKINTFEMWHEITAIQNDPKQISAIFTDMAEAIYKKIQTGELDLAKTAAETRTTLQLEKKTKSFPGKKKCCL